MTNNPFLSGGKGAPVSPVNDDQTALAEREALTRSLHSMLGILPQSYSGRENIKLLCHSILGATPHLRFVWVGFSKGDEEGVEPYAAAGDSTREASDWRLPADCFGSEAAYSQAFPRQVNQPEDLYPLYVPWRDNPSACSAPSALAIPLRSDNRGLQGMIVFYADSIDYFAHVGIDLFQSFCHVAEIIWKQSNLMRLLTQKSQLDPLTGLMSRRHTVQVLEKAMAHSSESGQALSIMICRIDDFKRFNDLYGWAASDAIVAEFAKELSTLVRPRDKGGRWAGVEFLFVLPGTGAREAEYLARQVREHFAANTVTVKDWTVRLALSIGVAQHGEEFTAVEDLVMQASMHMESGSDELPTNFP